MSTKRPVHGHAQIVRPRLIDAIDEGLVGHQLIFIHAVAGAGKSVLVDQWVDHRRLCMPDERVVHIAGDRVVDSVVQDLSGDTPDVLVVDDADHLEPAVLALLDGLLTSDAGPRMVMTARTRPALSLSRLGLDGRVCNLGSDDLALNLGELTELATVSTGELPGADHCLWLLHETEGWVAGVKLLVAASVTAESGGGRQLDHPAQHRTITDYIEEQVLAPLAEELRTFVLTTSVLDRLEATVCEAATGSSGGQLLLEELERRNLFLVPLDDRRVAYRYHRMFVDVLRHRFRTDDAAEWVQASLRAARWYIDAGFPHRGIDCMAKAQEWDSVVGAVMSHRFALMAGGAGRACVKWLTAVPKEVLDQDYRAVVLLADLHRMNGNLAEAESVISGLNHDAHDGRLDSSVHEFIAASWNASGLAWGTSPAEALESAVATEALLTSTEDQRRLMGDRPDFMDLRTQLVGLRASAAEALFHLGRSDEAANWAKRAVDAADHEPLLRAGALGTQAYISARSGYLVAAAVAAEEARKLNGSARLHPIGIPPELASVEVAYATDALDRADLLLAGLDEQSRAMHASTRVAQVTLARCAVAMGRGAFRHGLALLADHRREGWPVPTGSLNLRFQVMEACLLIFLGDVVGGRVKLRSSDLSLRDSPGAFLTLAAVERDSVAMRLIVDNWVEPQTLRLQAQYLVARVLLADMEGARADRQRHLEVLASLVVPERFIRPVLDMAPSLSGLIVGAARSGASPDLLSLRDITLTATRSDLRRPVSSLSPREQEVVGLLGTHLTNPEIAEVLEVSPNTLKTYLRRTYLKLGVSSRREAVSKAVDLGLLQEDPSTRDL